MSGWVTGGSAYVRLTFPAVTALIFAGVAGVKSSVGVRTRDGDVSPPDPESHAGCICRQGGGGTKTPRGSFEK